MCPLACSNLASYNVKNLLLFNSSSCHANKKSSPTVQNFFAVAEKNLDMKFDLFSEITLGGFLGHIKVSAAVFNGCLSEHILHVASTVFLYTSCYFHHTNLPSHLGSRLVRASSVDNRNSVVRFPSNQVDPNFCSCSSKENFRLPEWLFIHYKSKSSHL